MTGTNRAITSLKWILTLLGQCLLILFLGFIAGECWQAYQGEKMNLLFAKEGRPVQIVVDRETHEKRTWKDYIGNSKYLQFNYHNRPYTTRYVQDSMWVGEGSKLVLLYHEGLDEFRQPGLEYRREPMYKTSRIVEWTAVSLLSPVHLWLFLFLVLSTILLLFVLGMLSNLTGSTIIGWLRDVVATIIFLGAALYFTYDAYKYYSYVHQVKSNAAPMSVTMVDKDRRTTISRHEADWPKIYWYTAKVDFEKEIRVIAISEHDYDHVMPASPLEVLSNKEMDEMVSARYSYDSSPAIFVIVSWFLVIFTVVQNLRRPKK